MWLEYLGALMLVLGMALIYLGAHAHANSRTLYLTRDRDQVARFIPPIRN